MFTTSLQFFTFATYVAFIAYRYGIQRSVSHSYYLIKHQWLFTVVMWIVGICQCFHADLHPLFFLSGAGLCFLGAANAFNDLRMTYRAHLVGTVTAIVAGIVAFLFLLPSPIVAANLLITIPIAIYFFVKKTWVWWLECYYVLVFSIFLMLLHS